jgi:hypothetical protein
MFLSLFLYDSCASPGAVPVPPGLASGAVLTVDNPTPFTVYFERGQKASGKSRGTKISLAVEDAVLTGGFDILYEIPLSGSVRLFCKGDHRTIRENQNAFTVADPNITENYGTYIKITVAVDNAVSFYSGGEALPSWEQRGDPMTGNYPARTSRREFSRGETPVFRIDADSRYDSYAVRDSGKNIPLALPPKVEQNYLYSFEYTGSGVSLADARPLSRSGESAWVKTIAEARLPMPLVSAGGRLYLFASAERGLNRYDFDSAGNGGAPVSGGEAFNAAFAGRAGTIDGFFTAGYERDGGDYRPAARLLAKDGAPLSSLAPSARPDCRTAYFLTAAPKDGGAPKEAAPRDAAPEDGGASKGGAAWLAAGGGGNRAGYAAYVRLVEEEGGTLAGRWELAGDDFDTGDPHVRCGPVKAAAYDAGRDRWLVTGANIEFDSLRRPLPGSYIAAISGGGTIEHIDASFKGMSFNKIVMDDEGNYYLAGEERRGDEILAALVKFGADGGRLWRVSGPPSHSYYHDAVLDGGNSRIVLGGVMGAASPAGSGGVPFVQALDAAEGTSLWLEPLRDPALAGAALVTGICPAPDYGFALALAGISSDSYAEPFMIARINSQGVLFRYGN